MSREEDYVGNDKPVLQCFAPEVAISMIKCQQILVVGVATALIHCSPPVVAGPPETLSQSLIFHAPFDGGMDAAKALDKFIYTAESAERKSVQQGNHRTDVTIVKGAGRYGDAIRFSENLPQVLLYQGINAGYQKSNWSGTVSLWLKLNPDEDLKPGYCDPLQITDKTWNNAAFFVDFDKDLPRAFRLGVFPDYTSWNPRDTPWEQIAVRERPMVSVAKPPFQASEWTHVVYTFENINAADGSDATAMLYLNGESQGSLKRPMQFSWDPSKAAIMIGISYIGDFDDLAIFNRALTADEVVILNHLPEGVGKL